MLYDFHKNQNDRRPGTVHATYLVYGSKNAAPQPSYGSDGDVEMASSPPDAYSLADSAPSFTLTFIPEERLKGVWSHDTSPNMTNGRAQDDLSQYDEVVSIHIYSLESGPMKVSNIIPFRWLIYLTLAGHGSACRCRARGLEDRR